MCHARKRWKWVTEHKNSTWLSVTLKLPVAVISRPGGAGARRHSNTKAASSILTPSPSQAEWSFFFLEEERKKIYQKSENKVKNIFSKIFQCIFFLRSKQQCDFLTYRINVLRHLWILQSATQKNYIIYKYSSQTYTQTNIDTYSAALVCPSLQYLPQGTIKYLNHWS